MLDTLKRELAASRQELQVLQGTLESSTQVRAHGWPLPPHRGISGEGEVCPLSRCLGEMLPIQALPTVGLITSSLSSSSPHLDGFSDCTRGFNTPGCKSVPSDGLQQPGSLNKMPARAGSGRVALPTVKPRQGACCHISSVCTGLLPCQRVFHAYGAVEDSRGFQARCRRQKLAGKWSCPSPGWADTLQQDGDRAEPAPGLAASTLHLLLHQDAD